MADRRDKNPSDKNLISRPPAELLHADELVAIAASDDGPRPIGWRLSPRGVRRFIIGDRPGLSSRGAEGPRLSSRGAEGPRLSSRGAEGPGLSARGAEGPGRSDEVIARKFFGDDALVERAIVTLASNRGLMLVGEPGTAKSLLSELLAAAICGSSLLTIQGTAGTTEDQIKYSWNYARLLAEGPSRAALVAAPLYVGLERGAIVRFEEITRCQPEIQDVMISVLSDRVMLVPELEDDDNALFARRGFNVVATANTRDRGVHEMSSALKRRFNFETVRPLADVELETELVLAQARALLDDAGTDVVVARDVIALLVTTFHDLRHGRCDDGTVVERPSTVISTAEAVAACYSAAIDAAYLGEGTLEPRHVVRQLSGTVFKDDADDARRLRHYFDVVVKQRAETDAHWLAYYEARRELD